jgi:hypothetical protein
MILLIPNDEQTLLEGIKIHHINILFFNLATTGFELVTDIFF